MPDKGGQKAPSSYQKGGKNYKQGTVNGKPYEGELYYAAKKKPVKVVENITDANDSNYEYKLANPYQRNRVLKRANPEKTK